MTIYETLVKLLSVDFKDNTSETVQFEDLIKKLEKIRGKRYYIFEYKDVESVLKIFNIETKMPVFERLKKDSMECLNTGANECLIENAYTLKEISDLSDGTLLHVCSYTTPIHGWKDLQQVLSYNIKHHKVFN